MEQEEQTDKPDPALNNMMIVDGIHIKNHLFQCEREIGAAFQRSDTVTLKGHFEAIDGSSEDEKEWLKRELGLKI